MDLDTQDEIKNDPTENGKYHVLRDEKGRDILKVDMEGNILEWDEDGFVHVCETSNEPLFHIMLTIFNLGILAGSRDS